jgi:hypothetical protein
LDLKMANQKMAIATDITENIMVLSTFNFKVL